MVLDTTTTHAATNATADGTSPKLTKLLEFLKVHFQRAPKLVTSPLPQLSSLFRDSVSESVRFVGQACTTALNSDNSTAASLKGTQKAE
jgi:hypothetical protein